MLKIGIIGDALAPNFNEAHANQMYLLSRQLGIPVLTGNDLGLAPIRRTGHYLAVNTRFLRRGTPVLAALNGAFFYPLVKCFERKFDIILLPASIDSGFLNYLDLRKCILLVNTLLFDQECRETAVFRQRVVPKLRGIIAQSQRIKARLVELGVSQERIGVVYPWVDLDKFKDVEPPPLSDFRLVFASAPNDEIPGEDIFGGKGVRLLLESFRQFSESCNAHLYILWRGCYTSELENEIKTRGIAEKVTVINEVADMPQIYARSHVTVTPFLNTRRSPEIPLSAVESLACGRPVVTTDVLEIAEIVKEHGCGAVARPDRDSLVAALRECHKDYGAYQVRCRQVAESLFDSNLALKSIESFLSLSKRP